MDTIWQEQDRLVSAAYASHNSIALSNNKNCQVEYEYGGLFQLVLTACKYW